MPAWRNLLDKSLVANQKLPYAKFFQLATVRRDGKPANRTVVFRGFFNGTDDLIFHCDNRSRKVDELAGNPHAEVAWYFPESREQYRIAGTVEIIGDSNPDPQLAKVRQEMWGQQSDGARAQYTWPQPREPRAADDAYRQPPPPAQAPPLDTFCVGVLRPTAVDYALYSSENDRVMFSKQGENWTELRVNT